MLTKEELRPEKMVASAQGWREHIMGANW